MSTQQNLPDPYSSPATFKVKVGNQILTIAVAEPNGGFLMKEARIDPSLYYLVQIVNGQPAYAVDVNDNIDAALPGLEYLEPVARVGRYLLRVNDNRHALTNPTPTGREIMQLEGKSPGEFRLDQILANGEGRAIGPDEKVDLREPSIERFITVPHKEAPRDITIIVNGQSKVVHTKALSYDDVVNLAYDNSPPMGTNILFSVTYKRGPESNPQGSMTKGDTIKIKEGMVFNVTQTSKS